MRICAKVAKQIATDDVEYFLDCYISNMIDRAARGCQRSVIIDINMIPPISLLKSKYVRVEDLDKFAEHMREEGFTVTSSATRPNTRILKVEW